ELIPSIDSRELLSTVFETVPGLSQEKSSPTPALQPSNTAPRTSPEISSPTPAALQSSEIPKSDAPTEIPCEGVGQGIDRIDIETSNPNLDGVITIDDTSRVKDVDKDDNDNDDDDDEPLSTKWEILKMRKTRSGRKHIVVKPSPPHRPKTREAL
ncbi:hypothetical protein HAX54_048919, partial [Datura stramonium]|nr:hypothetical protein [Datura stramonium]